MVFTLSAWAPHGYFFGTALACENPLRIQVFKRETLTVPVFKRKTGFQPTSPRLNISTAFTAESKSIFMSNSTSFFFSQGTLAFFDINHRENEAQSPLRSISTYTWQRRHVAHFLAEGRHYGAHWGSERNWDGDTTGVDAIDSAVRYLHGEINMEQSGIHLEVMWTAAVLLSSEQEETLSSRGLYNPEFQGMHRPLGQWYNAYR
jgi:hypothetical protein